MSTCKLLKKKNKRRKQYSLEDERSRLIISVGL